MTLGDFLKQKLNEKNWSIHHFYLETIKASQASECRVVGRTQISDIIKKRVKQPGPRIIKVFAKTLGVSYYELLELAGYIDIEEFKKEVIFGR